ncbi:hypothetical protein I7I53_05505 [Histoplasma capsulatum var. duboisii H88]|uniref:Uncharacterized protein n=1 Tax=Ajellomyces capsulatus (strain H88) TaxID=544711 RepID=A0A8A1LYV0_AJEC8|nr:hypothetical protein I7I53_05505 [Histoplasma capsulatum var. duboisii H88]
MSTFGDPSPFLRVPKLLCGKLLHVDQLDSYGRCCCRKETKIGFEEVVIRLHPTYSYWSFRKKLKRGSKSTSLAEKILLIGILDINFFRVLFHEMWVSIPQFPPLTESWPRKGGKTTKIQLNSYTLYSERMYSTT